MRDYWNKAHSRDLIKFYLMLGLRYGEILQFINTVDDIIQWYNVCVQADFKKHVAVQRTEWVRLPGGSLISHWSAGFMDAPLNIQVDKFCDKMSYVQYLWHTSVLDAQQWGF